MDSALQVGEVFNWVDGVSLVVLAGFFFYGMVRGFMLQLLGIGILAGSLVLAGQLAPRGGVWIQTKIWSDLTGSVAHTVAFILIFLVTVGVGTGIAHLLKGVLTKAKVLPYDRFLGGLLGTLKGGLLIMVVVLGVVNLFGKEGPDAATGLVTNVVQSRTAGATRWTAEHVGVILPKKLADVFRKYAGPLGVEKPEETGGG